LTKEFFETLESEGLKATDYEYQQNLMKMFGEIFLQINDIIIYTKRAYGIEVIQKLFLGSISSPIIGLGDSRLTTISEYLHSIWILTLI